MNIDLSKLLLNDGSSLEYSLPDVIDSINVSGQVYPVRQAKPFEICIRNEGKQVLNVRYSGAAAVTIPCARCLEPVEYPIEFRDTRKVDMKLAEEERGDEAFFIVEKTLLPDLLFKDEVLLQWPIRVLCKADCKGICSQCGANLNKTVCGCQVEASDPRMAAIRDIFSQHKEV